MNEARKVGVAHGWMWLKQGVWLFRRNPFLWMVLTSILVVGIVGIATFPVVGGPLSALLFPAFFAGLMLGCHALASEERLELTHFFSGFQKHATPLVTLGGINLVAGIVLFGVMMATGGGALFNLMASANPQEDQEAFVQAVIDARFALLIGMALSFVVQTAVQFAAMLIVFRQSAPLPAVLTSLRAVWTNALPLTVYGLILVPLAILASVPMMLGWLLLLPIILTSQYATYRDMFPMPGDVVTDPPPAP